MFTGSYTECANHDNDVNLVCSTISLGGCFCPNEWTCMIHIIHVQEEECKQEKTVGEVRDSCFLVIHSMCRPRLINIYNELIALSPANLDHGTY